MQQHLIRTTVEKLTNNHVSVYPCIPLHDRRIPSLPRIQEWVDVIRSIVFPGFSGISITNENSLVYHTGVAVEKAYQLLFQQVLDALFFEENESDVMSAKEKACVLTHTFIERLPHLKYMLSTDVKAMFNSDPAATSFDEVIFCYPAIRAILNYRIAHELFLLEVPVLPRIITELAHSETGIDIHPGAQIGEYFSIDHGTGVVIGKTSIIGNHVTLYQGVTLGAKNFILNTEGHPLDVPRHPIIEDHVTIYSNSSILGRITIGHDTIIGGNIWLTNSVPPYSRILQTKSLTSEADI